MITAVIERENDTLITELPTGITDLQVKLLSIGIRQPPDKIQLFGGDDSEINVQLASGSRMAQHLCSLFTEDNTLADANTTAYLVQNADEAFKSDLEHDILYDQYGSVDELISDIKERTLAAGSVKTEFYFPVVGNIDEGDGNWFTVGDSYLAGYEYAVSDLVDEFQERELGDVADSYIGDAGLRAKLVSAVWSVEDIQGTLYGKTTVRLREELTDTETVELKDWITGQNSDGAFECLDDHPIDAEDGKLAVSLWHGGNDYFVYDRAEFDEYLEQKSNMKMGGM